MQPADYKLTDLLSTAGATIGIIIAAGILLGNLGAKYVAVLERYRQLAEEYRGNRFSDLRRDNVQIELSCYRRQVFWLNYATLFVSCALLFFLLTVVDAGLSVVWPGVLALRAIGTFGLMLGLGFLVIAVGLQFVESFVQRQAIRKEIADFGDHIPSLDEAMRR